MSVECLMCSGYGSFMRGEDMLDCPACNATGKYPPPQPSKYMSDESIINRSPFSKSPHVAWIAR